jgi:hypothetical protein
LMFSWGVVHDEDICTVHTRIQVTLWKFVVSVVVTAVHYNTLEITSQVQ